MPICAFPGQPRLVAPIVIPFIFLGGYDVPWTSHQVSKLRLTACLIASTLMSTKRLFLAFPNKPWASSGQGLRVSPRVALIWKHKFRLVGRALRLTGVVQSPVIERRYL